MYAIKVVTLREKIKGQYYENKAPSFDVVASQPMPRPYM